jgi:hypothetical protein
MKSKVHAMTGMRVVVEEDNGDTFSPTQYLNALMEGQDMRYWIAHPQDFNDWISKRFADRVSRLNFMFRKGE